MNLTNIPSYFHSAPLKTKLLMQKFGKSKKFVTFTKHFEVRFAAHTRNIIVSILNNLPECKLFWEENKKFIKTDKNIAQGILNTWNEKTLQFKITVIMSYITLIIQFLQQQLQKANLIVPDILISRDSAIRKLDLILEGPIPGGMEEKKCWIL